MADIVDTHVNTGSFGTLVAAFNAAGLVDTLKETGPFMVFAHTDEAFAKLPAGTMQLPSSLITACSQGCLSPTISQFMMSKHSCPYCSDVLLRHVRLGKLYWRCSCCHQEMPV